MTMVHKSPGQLLAEEVVVDVAITAAIVAGLVYFLHEPFADVVMGPIFIILVSASALHLVYTHVKRRRAARG